MRKIEKETLEIINNFQGEKYSHLKKLMTSCQECYTKTRNFYWYLCESFSKIIQNVSKIKDLLEKGAEE